MQFFSKERPNLIVMTDGVVFFVGRKYEVNQIITTKEVVKEEYRNFFGIKKTRDKIEYNATTVKEPAFNYQFDNRLYYGPPSFECLSNPPWVEEEVRKRLNNDNNLHTFGDVNVTVIGVDHAEVGQDHYLGFFTKEKYPGYKNITVNIPVFNTCIEAKAYAQKKLQEWDEWWKIEKNKLPGPKEVDC